MGQSRSAISPKPEEVLRCRLNGQREEGILIETLIILTLLRHAAYASFKLLVNYPRHCCFNLYLFQHKRAVNIKKKKRLSI